MSWIFFIKSHWKKYIWAQSKIYKSINICCHETVHITAFCQNEQLRPRVSLCTWEHKKVHPGRYQWADGRKNAVLARHKPKTWCTAKKSTEQWQSNNLCFLLYLEIQYFVENLIQLNTSCFPLSWTFSIFQKTWQGSRHLDTSLQSLCFCLAQEIFPIQMTWLVSWYENQRLPVGFWVVCQAPPAAWQLAAAMSSPETWVTW